MSSPQELLRIQYVSIDQWFLNYSDMVVYDKEQNLVAVRFGGYPETIQAMADAITMGCTLWISRQGNKRETQSCRQKYLGVAAGKLDAERCCYIRYPHKILKSRVHAAQSKEK